MFDWKEDYALGIEAIDCQHRELFRLADEVYGMIVSLEKEGQLEQVHALLKALKGYASEHFDTEEALMSRCGYEGLEAHRAEHEDFRNTVARLSGTEGQTPETAVTELIKFMTQWIFQHVNGIDRLYVPTLKACLGSEEDQA